MNKEVPMSFIFIIFDHIDYENKKDKEDNYSFVKEAQKRLLQLAYNLGLSKYGI